MAKKFLIVDDSASMRQLVSFTIKDAGHDVLVAENGKDALGTLNNGKVDMVITDLNMPEMDGAKTISALRQNSQDFSVLAMSGAPLASPLPLTVIIGVTALLPVAAAAGLPEQPATATSTTRPLRSRLWASAGGYTCATIRGEASSVRANSSAPGPAPRSPCAKVPG